MRDYNMSIYDTMEDGVKNMKKMIVAGTVACAVVAAASWMMPTGCL
jgi:hypothetical protein